MTDPFNIAILVGSPSESSRTLAVAQHVEQRLMRGAFRVRIINVRELPPAALLRADTSDPEIAKAVEAIEHAEGVVIASPVYKAAYSGLLKTFLDLLPQRGLTGKVVLPLATGGTLAHVLALDYALRPVLQSLEPRHIVTGLFLLDQWIRVGENGVAQLTDEAAPRLESITQGFIDGLRAAQQL